MHLPTADEEASLQLCTCKRIWGGLDGGGRRKEEWRVEARAMGWSFEKGWPQVVEFTRFFGGRGVVSRQLRSDRDHWQLRQTSRGKFTREYKSRLGSTGTPHTFAYPPPG